METSIPLSVVILAKNEAMRIRECIESVSRAGDVLVIDDESTDEQVEHKWRTITHDRHTA